MQNYKFLNKYNCIMMRWVAGYLEDDVLMAFLINARAALANDRSRSTRSNNITSYIFVLDNVVGPGEKSKEEKDERVRSRSEMEKLFSRASLIIADKSKPTVAHEDYDK